MYTCKKCGSCFEIPENVIEMVYVTYCRSYIRLLQKKLVKMPLIEYMKLVGRIVL